MNYARTLFLEDWFLSVLGLLALFAIAWGVWWLTKGRKRASARKKASRSAPKPQAAAPSPGPAQEDVVDKQERALLAQAMEAVLEAEFEEESQPDSSEPSEDTRTLIDQGLKGLDAFALTFQKMRAFNDPNASLQQISEAITTDLVFSGKVLKTANSPYFGIPGQVSSLHHAVLVMGLNNLKTLYFQEHFRMVGKETGRMAQVREAVWKHSITTAICASYLCKAFKIVPSETAFTLGLLHDLGKLVLADMAEGLEAQGEDLLDFNTTWGVAQEQQRLGADHAWIGRLAAEGWSLPKDTAVVIGAHHNMRLDAPPSDAAKAQLLTLVLANHLAHVLLEPATPPPPLPAAMEGKLRNKKRLMSAVSDPKLLEELQLARTLP